MAIPDYQSLMLPLLTVAAKGETRAPDAAEAIADQLCLTSQEREEMLPSNRQRLLYNRVHWAKFYLSKAGLIDSPRRGVFTASRAGRDLLMTSPQQINLETLKSFPAFTAFINQVDKGSTAPDQALIISASAASEPTPEEQIAAAHNVHLRALKADLLAAVLEQSPTFFERLTLDLLKAMGYGGPHDDAASLKGKSGDGGIDGVIDEDRLGLNRIYVQAKRYVEASIGRPTVQGFVGSLVGHGATKGVFITTSTFSPQAVAYAEGLQQRVILIDGARLTSLMVEFGVGVRDSNVITIKKIDENFFTDES